MTVQKETANIDDYALEGVGLRTDVSIRYEAVTKADKSCVLIEVAAKKRCDTPQQIYEFHDRARMIASLDHPHLFLPMAFGVTNGNYPFLVWRPTESKDLWDLLANSPDLLHRRFIARSFRTVCDALAIACVTGVFHDALYPSDLLLMPAAVMISGFGRMLLQPADAHAANTTFYTAPELWLGEQANERSEIYMIGCLLYEALTAEPYEISPSFRQAFERRERNECMKWLVQQRYVPVMVEPSVEPQKEVGTMPKTISRCLQLNPARRFEDLAQLKAELLMDCD